MACLNARSIDPQGQFFDAHAQSRWIVANRPKCLKLTAIVCQNPFASEESASHMSQEPYKN